MCRDMSQIFNQIVYMRCKSMLLCCFDAMNEFNRPKIRALLWMIKQGIFFLLTKSNQITVVAFQSIQLAQASFLQKNQMLQNVFLISVTLR